MTTTLAELARQAADRLRARLSPDQNAALDAEVLARHALGWDRARWLADARSAPPEGFAERFETLVQRRLRFEPVAYITGTREFYSLDFEVTPDVLIPRPETEILLEEALMIIDTLTARQGPLRVADVGTGSGCIAIALAHARPDVHVIATDISEAALDIAGRNALRHGVNSRVEFRRMSGLAETDVDLVVSNPPYVSAADAASLMRDVVDIEPHAALVAGGDGLEVIRAILAGVAARDPAPPCVFEFGGNGGAIREIVAASGLRVVKIVPDLAGIPRVAVVER